MPYVTDGTLTTDKRTIDDAATWDTQTEWEAYQSASSIEIENGVVQLAELTQPPSGISRWEYEDDSDATTAVDSWDSNPGAISGASYTTNALVGSNALSFDGVDDLVDFGDIPETDGVGQFTISVWIQPDDLSTFRYIAGKGSPPDNSAGYNLNTTDAGVVRCQVHDGSNQTITGSTLTTGTAYMLTGVIDAANSEFRLYTNDQRDATGTFSASAVTSTTEPLRHSWSVGGFDYFSGVGDDVRLYSKALTDTEVSDLYNTGSIL